MGVAKQPVSVCVKADSTFQSYRSGVLSKACSGDINHAVMAVGYSGSEYFKIRNSWGSSWGEAGYIRVAQNDGSAGAFCLLNEAPVVPVLSGASVEVRASKDFLFFSCPCHQMNCIVRTCSVSVTMFFRKKKKKKKKFSGLIPPLKKKKKKKKKS